MAMTVGNRFYMKRDTWVALAVISPSLIALAVFVYGFLGWTARVSVSKWRGSAADYTFVSLDNFAKLFADPRFHIDLRHTLIFTTLFVVGCLLLGLFLAMLLDQNLPGEGFFRSLFLFPMAISFIVTGVTWRWLLSPAEGARTTGLNLLFDKIGLDFLANRWHTTPRWGIAAVAIPAIWQMAGFTMALYLAGLRSVPDSLREAARVDGATESQLYRRVILPLMRPVTLSAIVILGHISLKVFDLIISMVGKQVALDVPAIYMYQTTFDGFFYGRGAAIAILILLGVALLVIPYLRYTLRQEAEL